MKHFLVVVFVCLQAFAATVTLAWSPLDSYRSFIEPTPQCYMPIAANEENQGGEDDNDADDDEPDCG